ncbi:class I SAM-dependent methyltransferase [Streptomyces clavuligerus]|nr:class I SAM-dependent methyltransferase [Streptomyces clavuligerus]MBY6307690.1 class I SAM-dependent methyltransferase [Streptomyces clavuligerus]QCS09763.1 class I SAM-dependent methyltransferase [Streptomyces clavuligerus]QPJ98514.1 methyltransferase domain-containing protein [Streptomyces clavuligerus]WDN57590.1 class I SAM-dependent methyltransferase [Streptomyces clavuligerus]
MDSADVKLLYEEFPYPSPTAESALIEDVANGLGFLVEDGELDGWKVLDVGCGTGHRLLGMALRYPRAHFTGVDGSAASLAVARRLAERHGARNVRFVEGLLPQLDLPTDHDLVVCTGLVHHLPDPRAGMRWLSDRLGPDGLLYLWLYHALGEHQRLLDRELVRLLRPDDSRGSGLETVRALGLTLAEERYGTGSAAGTERDEVRAVAEADAYLHPVVHAYRFRDVAALCDGLPLDWAAAFGVNTDGGSRFIDLANVEDDPYLCCQGPELVPPALRDRFARLDALGRLTAIELALRPTGLSVAAGRGRALDLCAPRLHGNVFAAPSRTAPSPGSLSPAGSSFPVPQDSTTP